MRYDAASVGQAEMGFVVENSLISGALLREVRRHAPALETYAPVSGRAALVARTTVLLQASCLGAQPHSPQWTVRARWYSSLDRARRQQH